MGRTIGEIADHCRRLRQARQSILLPMTQAEIVALVVEWARRWKDPASPWRCEAEALTEPFPFVMTRVSLEALLDSLTAEALWGLIDTERVRDHCGAPLVAHVIAGNTPLLAWTSVLRALLMRSASFVKLPSGGAGDWARLFVRSLAETSPALASAVYPAQWPGGTVGLDAALCQNVDLILAYGSQNTLDVLETLCPAATGFVGYGPRVSFGILPVGAPLAEAADGFARDVLLYDQGGCLSPHTIFVEGDASLSVRFAACLADALRQSTPCYPQASRLPHAAARVREARALARMEGGTRLWEDQHLRWTVIAREAQAFPVSPTHGVISVQPLADAEALAGAVFPVAGRLQGCAIANRHPAGQQEPWIKAAADLGVSWLCRPGRLQAPPFAWREDGRDVLRTLAPLSLLHSK